MAKYTVKWGDTLSDIAKENNTTVQDLVTKNNIADPNKIYAGQMLTIGDDGPATGAGTVAPVGGGNTSGNPQTQQPVTQPGTSTPAGQGASQPVSGMTGDRPGHQGTFDEQLNQLYEEAMGQKKFSYDLNGDPLWQQYSDQYAAKGKLAMLDTMGQAAALTGGHGSSYGQNVGQQAYQGYMQQLNDRVPELHQLALQKYNADQALLKDKLDATKAMDEREYGRKQDAADQLVNLVASTGYVPTDAELAAIGKTREQMNALAAQYEWEKGSESRAQERSDALARAELLAAAGDYSALAALYGVSEDVVASAYAAQNAQGYKDANETTIGWLAEIWLTEGEAACIAAGESLGINPAYIDIAIAKAKQDPRAAEHFIDPGA